MRREADVVVIGGGVNGLSSAYNLAEQGMNNVVLVEKRYLSSGATGRCGGGIRAQFSSKETIILARESEKIFENLSEELNFNVLFHQGGYLFLAYDEEEAEQLRESVKLQNSLGVKSKFLDPEEAKGIVPLLNIDEVCGASFHSRDGVALHFAVVWGYAKAAKKLGVEINVFTEVKDIRMENGEIRAVSTSKGEIKTSTVVNAAGAYSKDIAKMVGVELPNKPYRREALVSEPLQPFLNPLIVNLKGLWFFQALKGEIVGGLTDPKEPPSYNTESSLSFLERFAKAIIAVIPRLRRVSVLRQWGGLYDITPDSKPILGEVDKVSGFIQANGFSGHGFMLAPIVGKLTGELIIRGKTSISLEPFNLRRFEEGEIAEEKFTI